MHDGFFLAFGVFPAVALIVGLATGGLSNRYWTGAVGGAVTTLILTVTVANDSLLVWLPVHAAVGFIGGALGCLVRRLVTRMFPSPADWDRYEGRRWRAAHRYASAKQDDPDAARILDRSRRWRDAYLRWGRDCVGWAIHLFQK